MGGFKCKIDYLESLAVTRFSKKLIAPTYLEDYKEEVKKMVAEYQLPEANQFIQSEILK